MIDHHVVYVNRTLRTQADADELRIEIVARAMADANSLLSLSEPDRAYWRRKAKIAIQTLKDLAS